ncbi:MAG TPA: nuclear transport factor 2 family protein [Streptosporangiaceae bacterium]|jgi:hypothetical protein
MTPDVTAMCDTERRRLRSLVEPDLVTADALHAADYQLITPNGHALTKRDYLGDIAAGRLRYQVFEPASEILARCSSQLAILRYRARIIVATRGPAVAITCWHTDYYELREGSWQAVWSQATAISPQAAEDQPFSG